MIHIGELNSCFAQTKRNPLRRKARPVFHAVEPFFLSGGGQIAIAKQRRGVGMKRIEARNDQSKPFPISFRFLVATPNRGFRPMPKIRTLLKLATLNNEHKVVIEKNPM